MHVDRRRDVAEVRRVHPGDVDLQDLRHLVRMQPREQGEEGADVLGGGLEQH
jgi:hypothetical protein